MTATYLKHYIPVTIPSMAISKSYQKRQFIYLRMVDNIHGNYYEVHIYNKTILCITNFSSSDIRGLQKLVCGSHVSFHVDREKYFPNAEIRMWA